MENGKEEMRREGGWLDGWMMVDSMAAARAFREVIARKGFGCKKPS
jgi:hypothetical protein